MEILARQVGIEFKGTLKDLDICLRKVPVWDALKSEFEFAYFLGVGDEMLLYGISFEAFEVLEKSLRGLIFESEFEKVVVIDNDNTTTVYDANSEQLKELQA